MSTSDLAAASVVEQFLVGAAIVYLTYRLVRATDLYAKLSNEALDREWRPHLHLAIRLVEGTARLRVFVLSKNSILVTHLFLQIDKELETRKFSLDLPVPGLQSQESDDVTGHIVDTVRLHMTAGAWDGHLWLSVGFLLSGANELRLSQPPVRYHVVVKDGYVAQATRIPPFAAGTSESPFKE
jgi:hypothetical protein